jgi:hypothetical protein
VPNAYAATHASAPLERWEWKRLAEKSLFAPAHEAEARKTGTQQSD